MKTQGSTSTQASQCCQENADDHATFERWLDSPEGREWLNNQAENDDERTGRIIWNHDGFNPEPRYAH